MARHGFVPSSRDERAAMLADAGLPPPEQLFDVIPADLRLESDQSLPELEGPLSEMAIIRRLGELAAQNKPAASQTCFLGAGAYDHFQPAAVRHLTLRQEFYSSYTPYQPEISQGTLQGIFEFQTLVCRLTGLDVANSSMYDGASAAAEALLMACRQTGRKRVIVAGSVNPQTCRVVETYLQASGNEVLILPAGADGDWSAALAAAAPDGNTAGILVQSPDFFGRLQDLAVISKIAHKAGALAIASCDLLSLAVLRTPGETGVDIAVGEVQPLGLPLSYGGPYAGYLAARDSLLRRMPGRICGETVDREGRRAFVLTIQAREQHIRRDKATSNICTNEALCALSATIHAALLGGSGLREAAAQSAFKAVQLQKQLISTGWFSAVDSRPFFREFAVQLKPDAWLTDTGIADLNKYLADRGIIGGFDLSDADPQVRLDGGWLLAVTEKRSQQDIDSLIGHIADYRRTRGCQG